MDIEIYRITPWKKYLLCTLSEKQFRLITGLLGMTAGLIFIVIYHSYKQKKQREVIKNVDRGGEEFKDLIDPALMYEIKDPNLAEKILEMVNFNPGGERLVIDARIAIKAVSKLNEYVNSKTMIKVGFSFLVRKLLLKDKTDALAQFLISTTGLVMSSNELQVFAPTMGFTRFALNGLLPFGVGAGTAIGSYAWLVPLLIANPTFPVTLLLSGLLSFTCFTVTNSGMTTYYNRIDRAVFNDLVRPIPSMILNNDETENVFLIPEPTEESHGIYIRSEQGEKKTLPSEIDVTVDAEFEIWTNSINKIQPTCSISEKSTSMFSRSSKVKIVECESTKTEIVPLKFRTKTWSELVKEGEMSYEAEDEKLFEPYNQKANDLRQKREKVNSKKQQNPQNDLLEDWDVEKWLDELNDWE